MYFTLIIFIMKESNINQSSNHIFMIEPVAFQCNPQTAETNAYQEKENLQSPEIIAEKALNEFKKFKNTLTNAGIKITSLQGSPDCPDHIFPNWFITFQDKTMQLFSMMAPNRRIERKPEMIDHLSKTYELTKDYSYLENENIFLESTSSMVIDRVNKCVFAGISERTNATQLVNWCDENNFELVQFETLSHNNAPIYHTDVFMFVGTEIIGICYEVIDEKYRDTVRQKVERFHDVFEITKEQIMNFCGNALEAQNEIGEYFLIMSSKAHSSLTSENIVLLKKYYKDILHSDISTIEKYGGGSARCMLAELF